MRPVYRAVWFDRRVPAADEQTAARQALAAEPFVAVACAVGLHQAVAGARGAFDHIATHLRAPDDPPDDPSKPTRVTDLSARLQIGDERIAFLHHIPLYDGTCRLYSVARVRDALTTVILDRAAPDQTRGSPAGYSDRAAAPPASAPRPHRRGTLPRPGRT